MPNHSKRILVVNCNCDRPGARPAYYPARKYEFKFPEDSMKPGCVAAAKTQYATDENIATAHRANITTTCSTYHK